MAQQWILQGLLSTDRRLVDPSDEQNPGRCTHGSELGETCGACQQDWFQAMIEGKPLNVTVIPPTAEEINTHLVNREARTEYVEPEDTLPLDTGDPTIGAPGYVDQDDIAARTVAEDDPINTEPGPDPYTHIDQ